MTTLPFAELAPGTGFGPHEVTVGPAANERYWRAAGVEHPSLEAGALYPLIAANLTILAFQQACPDPVIQTRQRLVCHGRAHAGTTLVTRGAVVARYAKRGRDYVDIEATVTVAGNGAPLWTSQATFTPTATIRSPG